MSMKEQYHEMIAAQTTAQKLKANFFAEYSDRVKSANLSMYNLCRNAGYRNGWHGMNIPDEPNFDMIADVSIQNDSFSFSVQINDWLSDTQEAYSSWLVEISENPDNQDELNQKILLTIKNSIEEDKLKREQEDLNRKEEEFKRLGQELGRFGENHES